MIHFESFLNRRLTGGFVIKKISTTHGTLEDALNRDAVAKTRIVGYEFEINLRADLPVEEISITLYHEILEAATVASKQPPQSVCELNEAGFEAAAHQAHKIWGEASIENINRMLQFYGFREE